jgi:hypothetical protein
MLSCWRLLGTLLPPVAVEPPALVVPPNAIVPAGPAVPADAAVPPFALVPDDPPKPPLLNEAPPNGAPLPPATAPLLAELPGDELPPEAMAVLLVTPPTADAPPLAIEPGALDVPPSARVPPKAAVPPDPKEPRWSPPLPAPADTAVLPPFPGFPAAAASTDGLELLELQLNDASKNKAKLTAATSSENGRRLAFETWMGRCMGSSLSPWCRWADQLCEL